MRSIQLWSGAERSNYWPKTAGRAFGWPLPARDPSHRAGPLRRADTTDQPIGVRRIPWSEVTGRVTESIDACGPHSREDKSGLHQLRRTFISAVLHNGGDVETARDLAGHSSIVVTQAYVASTNEIKRRAVEALDY